MLHGFYFNYYLQPNLRWNPFGIAPPNVSTVLSSSESKTKKRNKNSNDLKASEDDEAVETSGLN